MNVHVPFSILVKSKTNDGLEKTVEIMTDDRRCGHGGVKITRGQGTLRIFFLLP